MSFRGCDESFANAWEYAKKHPREFSIAMQDLARAMEATEKYRKELGKRSKEDYDVGSCPFHGFGRDYLCGFSPDSFVLRLEGKKHKFHRLDCGELRYCDSIISFDEDLLEELAKKDLKRVVSSFPSPKTICPSCGSKKGKIYKTDLEARIVKDSPLIEGDKIYLFERPCHTYAAATTESVLLYPIRRTHIFKDGKISFGIAGR